MKLQQILDDFALFDTWEDKYRYLIEMGNGLAPLGQGEQVAANKVSGCVSQVWLVSEPGCARAAYFSRHERCAYCARADRVAAEHLLRQIATGGSRG